MRLLIFPYILTVILTKYAQIKAVEILSSYTADLKKNQSFGQYDQLIILFGLTYFNILANELISFVFTPFIQNTYRIANREAFEHFISLEHKQFKRIGSGEVHSSVERRSAAVADILEVVAIDVFPILVSLLFATYKIFAVSNWWNASILVLAVTLLLGTTVRVTNFRTVLRREANRKINKQSNLMYDTLVNYETVLAHNNQSLETARYDNQLQKTSKLQTDLYQSYYVLNYLQRFVLASAQHVILLVPALFTVVRTLDTEAYVSLIRIYDIVAANLFKSGYIYSKYAIGIVNYETSRVRNVRKPREAQGVLPGITEKVVFDKVCIYHETRLLLRNLCFEVFSGEKIAIVGRNGIGKSTLLKTLLGFTNYDGKILLDGKDMKNYTLRSIRDKISYIHQDSGIFNETVKYNIAYGNPGIGMEEIQKVCTNINIHESIMRLDKGYNTIAGERGSFLSGGERQKIAFARAVARNADILILDEPTASLDKHAEADIFKMVFEHSDNRTTFIIVHNLDLLRIFDRIIFLKDIDEMEIGRYDELLNKRGSFYDFILKHRADSDHSIEDVIKNF